MKDRKEMESMAILENREWAVVQCDTNVALSDQSRGKQVLRVLNFEELQGFLFGWQSEHTMNDPACVPFHRSQITDPELLRQFESCLRVRERFTDLGRVAACTNTI
jgi:hypothetical protein